MSELLDFFYTRTEEMVTALEHLVRLESPTESKLHVDAVGEHVAALCADLGAAITVYPQTGCGDIRLAIWNGDAPGKPIMLLTHLDTVWPVGTLATMSLRREGDRLYGPGAADMKGGIVVVLEAIRGLRDRGELPKRPIWLLMNTDEETGSFNSRTLIRELASQVGLVLVMEPATEAEAIKAWRKGIARYVIRTIGRAAHAGQAPETGINAIVEAAHQTITLHGLNDLPNGTSVSTTMISGGITSNVIPPETTLQVDARFLKQSEAERIDHAIQHLTPVLPGAKVEVTGGIDRGPMERDAQMIRVVQHAQAIAAAVGIELHEDGSGGASDGNFTAAMGIPTLDGMGPTGVGLHATHEHTVIRSIPRRAAFLARLLLDWDMNAI